MKKKQFDTKNYILHAKDADIMKMSAVIMHPLPRRAEMPPEIDRNPRAVYWRQMRNGMWIRAALIAQLFRRENDIRLYASSEKINQI